MNRWATLPVSILSAACALPLTPALAQAPGGFLERADGPAMRPVWTASQIQAFLPARGKFKFPAPYNTDGIRLTNASDCGGSDCVNYVGYSYWRNINNHRGSNTMLIFLGLERVGPTLFRYDKQTDQVENLGPLFDASSPLSSATGEGWHFSATLPTKLYVTQSVSPALLRYDVLAKTFETVFDATTQFGSGKYIWQTHSSDDDKVHSATLRQTGTWKNLGCLAYREDTRQFFYYPVTPNFDECQIDKSGRWLVIKDDVDGIPGEDNRIIDLQTGAEKILLDYNGAAGHSDNGYGYMVAADNWNNLPGALRVWRFDETPLRGPLAYHSTSWSLEIEHVSHTNAQPNVPLSQQYACGTGATAAVGPRANEIVCFRMDASLDLLVVAQNMTNVNAAGGGDAYGKSPKGNLDVTGGYFIWTSNMGGNRLDAFLVKVPAHLLTGTGPDTVPPNVLLAAPAPGSSVSGFVTVAAEATDDVGVASVQFRMDGVALGGSVTTPPYAISWNTAAAANGSHTLTAVARDAADNASTSPGIAVTVNNTVPGPVPGPVISSVSASTITSTGATIAWSTNTASSTQVEYGPTSTYGNMTALNATLVTSHSQALSGSAGGTLHYYRVRSRDAGGTLAVSGQFTFTTAAGPRPDPIAHLKLDEASGLIAADSSGHGHQGSLVNGPGWTAGRLGTGVSLDGVDNYVRMAHASPLNAFPLSVAVWFKTNTAAGAEGLVNKYVASAYDGYQMFFKNGNLCAWYIKDAANRISDGGECTMRTPGYNDNQWHQAVFTADTLGGRLYVDGVPKSSQPWTGLPGAISTVQDIHLGHYPGAIGGGYLPGAIDDLRIYDRALSADEVLQLYNQEPPVSDLIFKDGFESGTMAAWSAASTAGSALHVSAAAALAGTSSGVQGSSDAQASLYVQDDTPQDESRYRARFYVDPNGFDPGEDGGDFRTQLFAAFHEAPLRQLVTIVLRRKAGLYSIMGRVRLDDGTWVSSPFFPISDAPHAVELDWRRASAPGAADGGFQIWVDGVAAALAGLDNGARGVDVVQMGMLNLNAGASGTIHWDEFESRRQTYIGPVP